MGRRRKFIPMDKNSDIDNPINHDDFTYILDEMSASVPPVTKNIPKDQLTIYDIYFDKKRETFNNEKANLSKKMGGGYMDANWFRRNMFNATSRGKHNRYKKFKTIFENTSTGFKIMVSHSLHQKHADVISILFTDYAGIEKQKDGSLRIFTSLYHIAKKMGYKYPERASENIKSYIDEIRLTDFKIVNPAMGVSNFTILGDSDWSNIDGSYYVDLGVKSARVLAMSTGLSIAKPLNEKIVLISDKTPKLKALIRYVIASKPPIRGYYTLEHIFDKYGIGKGENDATNRKDKSNFRKELKDHTETLGTFNITYDAEKQRIYYEGHEQITFESGIKPKQIVEKLIENDLNRYIDSYIQLPDNDLVRIVSISEVDKDYVRLEIYNHKISKSATIKKISKKLLEASIDLDATEYYKGKE